jgi:hypothetical protein
LIVYPTKPEEIVMRIFRIALPILLILSSGLQAQDESSYSGELTADLSDYSLLEVRTPQNLRCDIRLNTHKSNMMIANYRIWAKARTKAQESRFIKLIEVRLDQEKIQDGVAKIRVLAPTTAPWEGTSYSIGASLDIKVPENFGVDSRSMYGDVEIDGPLSLAEINCDYGTVRITNVIGETNIKSSYADIEVGKLTGEVMIEAIYSDIYVDSVTITDGIGSFQSSNGEIELRNIVGPIEAFTSLSNIIAVNLAAESGSILLRTTYGRIDARQIRGELVAETSYEPIELEDIYLNFGFCKIETSYSPIDVKIVEINDAQLIVNNSYNSININLPKNVSSKLILNVDEGGRIHTKGLSIKPLAMDKNRLVGMAGSGVSRIEANLNGIGEIYIQGY